MMEKTVDQQHYERETRRLTDIIKLTHALKAREDLVFLVFEAIYHFGSDACPKCGYQKPPCDVLVEKAAEKSATGFAR